MHYISIIIPCYNSEATLEKCVRSAFAQDWADKEVICIDDGSTDSTWPLLEALTAEFPQLHLIRQGNSGATAARNRGLRYAKGDYIQFLDSDDHLLPSKVSYQLSSIKNDVDIIIGSYRRRDEQGRILGEKVYESLKEDPWSHLINTDLGCTCSNLFRASKVLEVGGWDEELRSSQEYDLMFRMLKEKAIARPDGGQILTEVLVRKSGSISTVNREGNWKRFIDLRLRMRDYLSEENPDLIQIAEQKIFDAIRQLYAMNRQAALNYLKNHLPADFVPAVSKATSSFYIKVYRILGFRGAESVRRLLGR